MFHPYSSHSLLTVQQMRSAERFSLGSGLSEREMIEAAGSNAAGTIARLMSTRNLSGEISLLCGAGNNGADGLATALNLHRLGYELRVILTNDRSQSPENSYFWQQLRDELPEFRWHVGLRDLDLELSVVLVDALFGIGFNRSFTPELRELAQAYNQCSGYKVALDIPSGLDADSGKVLGWEGDADAVEHWVLKADLTLTFFRAKAGQWLYPGSELCGQLRVLDCGIESEALAEQMPTLWGNDPELWGEQLLPPQGDSHKYSRAPVYLEAGKDYPGAASLVAAGAQALGASYLAVASAPSVDQGDSAWVTLPQPLRFERDLSKYRALLVGPGCEPSEDLRRQVARLLHSRIPCVLDAGALTCFASDPHTLVAMLHSEVVLTPHAGEFRRLFPELSIDQLGRLTAAQSAAEQCQCTLILKGPDSVVAGADGRAVINGNASSKLATAGSGDVLSGALTALMAQSIPPFAAACAAVWIHGEGGNKLQINSSAAELAPAIASVYRFLLTRSAA